VTDLSQNSSMRYLTVVRHAKSSPAKPGESDFARTLNKRGREECERLREWASDPDELGRYGPTTALVSSAARTRETFRRPFTHGVRGAMRIQRAHLQRASRRQRRRPPDRSRRHRSGDDVAAGRGAQPTVHEVMITLAKDLPKSLRGDHYALGARTCWRCPTTARSASSATRSSRVTSRSRDCEVVPRRPDHRHHRAPPPPRRRRVDAVRSTPRARGACPTCRRVTERDGPPFTLTLASSMPRSSSRRGRRPRTPR